MTDADMKIYEANNVGWISLKDKFPPLDEEVLVNTLYGMRVFSLTQSAHETSDVYWEDSYGYYQEIPTVTHWMPLPELPEEEKQK